MLMPGELDLIGVGTPSMDILYTEDGMMGRFGGSVATAVVAISKWGMKTGILGRTGKDHYGMRLLGDFISHNVDVSHLKTDNETTSIWHIRVAEQEREVLYAEYYKPLVTLSAQDTEYIKQAKSVFVRFNNPLFREIASLAGNSNVKLFITFHMFEPEKNNDSLHVLERCSPEIIFINEAEAEKTGNFFVELIEKNTVVVTRGKNGCSVYKSGERTDYSTIKVKTIDPTGAGDAFAAGFIYGHLNNWPLDKAAMFANTVGAMVTMDYGARTKIPTIEEAMELVQLSVHE